MDCIRALQKLFSKACVCEFEALRPSVSKGWQLSRFVFVAISKVTHLLRYITVHESSTDQTNRGHFEYSCIYSKKPEVTSCIYLDEMCHRYHHGPRLLDLDGSKAHHPSHLSKSKTLQFSAALPDSSSLPQALT